MDNKTTQNKEILAFMKEGHTITQFEAARLFSCYRLSARIHDLRELGYDIKTTMKTGKKPNGNTCNYAEYELKMTEAELMCDFMCDQVEEGE